MALAITLSFSGIGQAAETTYGRCMKLAHAAPDKALAEAKAWLKSGGGQEARHCRAVALITKGQYRRGAQLLTGLAGDIKGADSGLKPELLAQAGQAWLMAGESAHAVAQFTEALGSDPKNAGLLTNRAIAFGLQNRFWEAIDDLNTVLDLAPGMAEAWLLRAAAYRKLSAFELAAADAERAIALAPKHAEAWLERGIIHDLAGNSAGALAAWKRAVHLDRGGQSGRDAQANLDRLNAVLTGTPPAPTRSSPSR
jgi:tetratricopeptide (TPR) repeat protein